MLGFLSQATKRFSSQERKPLAAQAFVPVAHDLTGGVAQPGSSAVLIRLPGPWVPRPGSCEHLTQTAGAGVAVSTFHQHPSGTKWDRRGALSAPGGGASHKQKQQVVTVRLPVVGLFLVPSFHPLKQTGAGGVGLQPAFKQVISWLMAVGVPGHKL